MQSGYVLDFSNKTFTEFVHEVTGRDIYDGRYSEAGTSKANHLRTFWKIESDQLVARLTEALIEHGIASNLIELNESQAAHRVFSRLQQQAPVADLDAIRPNTDEPTFDLLARSAREAIDAGRPEEGLDRLHTFLTKYLRVLCGKRGIDAPKDKPLHSLMGEYIKKLRDAGVLRSAMAERIMKSTISSLEAFNQVRNDQSLAHDNRVLGSHEALYIFNHVASLIRFLQVIDHAAASTESEVTPPDGQLPF